MTEKNYSYIIADHIRAACMIIVDGVTPSGKQRGYVLRRLIRRALSASIALDVDISNRQYFEDLVDSIIGIYDGVYEEIKENKDQIVDVLFLESSKYLRAMKVGQKEWSKLFDKGQVPSENSGQFLAEKTWDLYQTHGVPMEVSEDVLKDKGLEMDSSALEKLIEEHQKKSQSTSAGQFKSGLGENTEETKRLHTVTHILHRVLRNMFGEDVHQVGSAITSEKARFDFTLDKKLDENEVEQLTKQIQEIIDAGADMSRKEMTQEEARELGATGLFGEKYGDKVTIYSIIGKDGTVYSREFCGGPHVENTSEVGTFKILKQKSVGQGKKRIEYTVE